MSRANCNVYPTWGTANGEFHYEVGGLTIREHFAAMAMQGLLSNLSDIRREGFNDKDIEAYAVMRADALIAELAKVRP
jgi:hypothetical protein